VIATFSTTRGSNRPLPPRGGPAVRTSVAVTIVERRAPWRPDFGPERTAGPVARLRDVHKYRHWTLFWRDRNQRWHRYDLVEPTADVTVLLGEIERDPTGIFWG